MVKLALHLLRLYWLLAIVILSQLCLGAVPICAASGGVTLAHPVAPQHLPHARAASGACEHAFAGEVAQSSANSSARHVAAWSLASPRIARVGAGKYEYDAFGRRIQKTKYDPRLGAPAATVFVWDGEVLAAELDNQTGPRAFVHEPGSFEPILQQQNGEVFLCVNDHLGMPKDLVASDGAVAWSASHSAYGRIVSTYQDPEAATRFATNPVKSPFRLLGQVADEDAELCWTRFRCFDPETGTWMSTDPLEIAGGWNLHGFNGTPTRIVDPLGLTGDGHKKSEEGEVITEGTVYRGGSASDSNLTPRPVKDTSGLKRGLSTFDTPEKAARAGEKFQTIDVAKLGPDLEAFRTSDGHVSIRPKDDAKLADWAAQRGQPNALTDQVRQARTGQGTR